MRSLGLITSVRRIPNFSFTTTTSPWAIRVPLTNTSSGSPASRSSSTTEPWLSCNRLRMLISVLPTSMEIDTGISRITSRFGPSRLGGVGLGFGLLPNSSSGARGIAAAAGAAARWFNSASISSWPASPASARAEAHSSASACSSVLICSCSSAITCPQCSCRQAGSARTHSRFQYLQGQVALVRAELDLEGRHAVGAQNHVFGHFHRDNVARLHVEDVTQLELASHHGGAERNVDIEHILAQSLGPTFVLIADVRLEAGIEHLADRLNHRIRHGYVEIATAAVQLDMECRNDNHLA